MLKKADNQMLTQVGEGTPMGNLLRRFWMPVLLEEEICDPDGPPVRVRILGEDLVAFKNTDGKNGFSVRGSFSVRIPIEIFCI